MTDSSSERARTEALVPEAFILKNGMCDVEDELFCHISFSSSVGFTRDKKTF